jgi:hypothetical protein
MVYLCPHGSHGTNRDDVPVILGVSINHPMRGKMRVLFRLKAAESC